MDNITVQVWSGGAVVLISLLLQFRRHLPRAERAAYAFYTVMGCGFVLLDILPSSFSRLSTAITMIGIIFSTAFFLYWRFSSNREGRQ